jgi:predicted kinase
MKRVILTRGLVASGKTSWCKQLQAKHPGQYKHISKDDLRAMLDDGKWSGSNEKMVLKARDLLINLALDAGKHVLIDDTNLNPLHEQHIRETVKARGDAEVEIKDFTDVPLEVCIERDLKRPNSVGEKVIRKMYNEWLRPEPPKIEPDPALPDAIICDLDGMLALLNGRNPYDASTCDQDELCRPVWEVLDRMEGKTVLLVSGRMDTYRPQTEAFLHKHDVRYSYLFMRAAGDTRKDFVVKQEIYEREIRGKYNVLFVLDDRDQVVEMWRGLGLTVFQVAEGDF